MQNYLSNFYSDVLTPREEEVHELMMEGLNTKQIADRLFIAHSTANTHKNIVFSKKKVHSQPQLMALRIKELEKELCLTNKLN